MPLGDPQRSIELGFTANGRLNDRAIRHALFLERVKSQEVKAVLDLLDNEVVPGVIKNLQSTKGNFSADRLRKLAINNNSLLRAGMSKAASMQVGRLGQVAVTEAQWQTAAAKKAMGIDIEFNQPSIERLQALVTESPFGPFGKENKVLGKWWSSLGRSTADDVHRTIKAGVARGDSVDEIANALGGLGKASEQAFGPLGKMKVRAKAVARTATAHVAQEAREASYAANADVIKGVQIVATLDSRTTEICMGYDGKVFPVKEGPRPPFHFNCRTVTAPVTKSFSELLGSKRAKEIGLKDVSATKRAALGGEVPAKTTYGEWLKNQPPHIQNLALGKKKAEMFRDGKFKVERLVNQKGQRLTVKQLADLEDVTEFALEAKFLTADQQAASIKSLIKDLNKASGADAKLIRTKLRKVDPEWSTKYDKKTGGLLGGKTGNKPPPSTASSKPAPKVVVKGKPKGEETVVKPVGKSSKKIDNPKTGVVSKQNVNEVMDSRLMVKVDGKQGGSSQNALFVDTDGSKWLVKKTKSVSHSNNEVLASKLYNAARVDASEVKLAVWEDGSPAVAVRWVDNLTFGKQAVLKSKTQFDGFTADALFANWDTVGLSFDNMAVNKGKAFRVDLGGSLAYRATGQAKGGAFTAEVNELSSFFTLNPQTKAIFGGMDVLEAQSSFNRVVYNLDMKDNGPIHALVKKYPIGTPDQVDKFWKTLKLRHANLEKIADELDKYGTSLPGGEAKSHLFTDFLGVTKPKLSKSAQAAKAVKEKIPEPDSFVSGFNKGDADVKVKFGDKPGAKLVPSSGKVSKSDPFELDFKGSEIVEPTDYLKVYKPDGQWQRAVQPSVVDTTQSYSMQYDKWAASLKKDEIEAIASFTGGGYTKIRKAMMGAGDAGSVKKAAEIQKALARAPRVQSTQFRGITLKPDEVNGKFNGFKVGEIFEQKAHDSWSTTASVAKEFSQWAAEPVDRHPVMFVSHNKAGVDIRRFSKNKHENEVISPAGAKFRIVSTERFKSEFGPDRILVHVEEIFDGVQPKSNVKASSSAPAAVAKTTKSGQKTSNKLTVAQQIEQAEDTQSIKKALSNNSFIEKAPNISKAPITTQKIIAKQISEFAYANPEAASKLSDISIGKTGPNQLAVFKLDNKTKKGSLVFNSDVFAKPWKESKMLDLLHKQGEIAGNTLDYVVNHEVGHAIDKLGDIGKLVRSKFLTKNPPKAKDLSKYATKSLDEAFAEAYAVASTTPSESWNPWVRKFAKALKESYSEAGGIPPAWMKDI